MTGPDTLSSRSNVNGDIPAVLRSLPRPVPPPELHTRLRVVGSREAARRRALLHPGYWLHECCNWFSTLMRPLAIPTAGGFVSALVLFGLLAPTLIVREVANAGPVDDVRTVLYKDPTVKSYLPVLTEGHDVVVDLTVDDQGRLLDYAVSGTTSPELLKKIQSQLLTMQFNPATTFGQPTSGRARIWFRTSRIEIRG